MQMTLVEDPDNGITIKHSLDSGATFIAGFPQIGTVCQFQFEGFEFVGIFQRYNYSESTGGRKYDVTFESPSKILDGVQVILSGFEGTAFTGNYPFFPSEDVNFTSQLNNIYNPFGVKENYAWGGTFGNSDYNLTGFPVPDDPNKTGLAAKGLLTMIEEISQSKYTYDNPNGPSINTSVNSNDEELIGGPICYGDSKFVISFGTLKSLVPSFFRMPGTTQSINAILQECCELIVHDYVTIIDPVYSQVLTGYGTGVVPEPQYEDVFRNGVTPTKYDADGNVTGPVISFKYLDKSEQPQPGVVADLVEEARLNKTLISANNGQEYADVVTQKMIIGDKASRVWEAGMEYLIPVYGQDINGEWLLGSGFAATDIAPVALDSGGVYNAKVQELTAALSGFEVWSLYHDLGRAYGYSSMSSSAFGSIAMAGMAQMNQLLKDRTPGPAFMAGFSGDYHTKMIQEAETGNTGGKDAVKFIYDAVLNTAQNYYGKTYFVMLPVEPGGIPNNIRYKNDFETESAWEIANAGWDPNFRMKNIEAYNDEGALKACAGYYPSQSTAASSRRRDFSSIEKTLIYDLPGAPALVGTIDVKVDKKIYWRKNPYHQNNNNPYDDVSAMVHIECPRVFEYDEQATEKAALDSLFNNQVARTAGLPANTPGFKPAREGGAGAGYSSASSFESELMTFKYMPTAVRPFKVSIPQTSTRYSWGPWYRFSAKIGKADLEKDTKLKPETFGSMSALDEAAFSLTYAGTADLYASESGSVDLAEFPQYNIADRFDQNGPYITKMDVSVGAGGITTKYQFSTWTRNFGKMAKYNIDRIAKINKNKIAAAKRDADSGEGGGGSSGGGGQTSSSRTGMQNGQKKIDDSSLNFFSGLGIIAGEPKLDDDNNLIPLGPSSWVMSMRSGNSLQHQYHRKIKVGNQVYTSYDISFGCTPEQVFSPVGIKKEPDDVNAGILPYGNAPEVGENIAGVGDTNSSFELGHASPTAGDLDPYFKFPKLDFGAVVMEDMKWLKDHNMHLSNSGNAIDGKVTQVRTYGLRGPLLLSGWGYDVMGHPVPGKQDGVFDPVNPAENRGCWKTGPVDLMWDEERQVWAGGLQFIEGVLRDPIGAANAVDDPDTNGVVNIYRKTEGPAPNPNDPRVSSWASSGDAGGYGTVRLTNRDPSLTAETGAYVMAVRINQEWRVIYVGCAVS
jgi:hypothetical protein